MTASSEPEDAGRRSERYLPNTSSPSTDILKDMEFKEKRIDFNSLSKNQCLSGCLSMVMMCLANVFQDVFQHPSARKTSLVSFVLNAFMAVIVASF